MIEDKIKSKEELIFILQGLKNKGKKIVFTNGCFDLLHYGHVKYLEEAKTKGEVLVIGLNSDSSVGKIKGKNRPITGQYDRACILAALASVDYVTIFDEETPLELIKQIMPNILIKGGDWDKEDIVGKDVVIKSKGKVITIPLAQDRSTSNIIEKIKSV